MLRKIKPSSVCAAVEETGKELSQEYPDKAFHHLNLSSSVLPSEGESIWQPMHLKATALLRNKCKTGPLRDLQITTEALFGFCAAQHQALAGG